MKIRNKTNRARTINDGHGGITVEPGESVDIDADLARRLMRQSDRWGRPTRSQDEPDDKED